MYSQIHKRIGAQKLILILYRKLGALLQDSSDQSKIILSCHVKLQRHDSCENWLIFSVRQQSPALRLEFNHKPYHSKLNIWTTKFLLDFLRLRNRRNSSQRLHRDGALPIPKRFSKSSNLTHSNHRRKPSLRPSRCNTKKRRSAYSIPDTFDTTQSWPTDRPTHGPRKDALEKSSLDRERTASQAPNSCSKNFERENTKKKWNRRSPIKEGGKKWITHTTLMNKSDD